MPDKETQLIQVTVLVRVTPAEAKPYSTIVHLTPLQQITRLVEEKCIADLQYLDGVDAIEDVRTQLITPRPDSGIERRSDQPRREADRALDSMVAGARIEIIADPHLNPQRCPSCNSPDVLRRNYSILAGAGCSNEWHDQPVIRRPK